MVAAGTAMIFVAGEQLQGVAFAVETMILAGLFLVTAFYANKTSDIAEGTRQQAEATKKLAEEAEAQRLVLWEPLIQPSVRREVHPVEMLCANNGKGDAYKIEPMIIMNRDAGYCKDAWHRGQNPKNEPQTTTRPRWEMIRVGDSENWSVDGLGGARNYVAAVLYEDRFGRQFISGYAFSLEQDGIRPTGAIPPRLFKEALS